MNPIRWKYEFAPSQIVSFFFFYKILHISQQSDYKNRPQTSHKHIVCLKWLYPRNAKMFTYPKNRWLQWRHNRRDGVSNHLPYDCLLNRLFGRRSRKTSKLRVIGLCVGIHRGPLNSPHKWPVTRKMFPFEDVYSVIVISCMILRHFHLSMLPQIYNKRYGKLRKTELILPLSTMVSVARGSFTYTDSPWHQHG